MDHERIPKVGTVHTNSGKKLYLEANIAGEKLTFLVDTGADVSIITQNSWDQLPSHVRDSDYLSNGNTKNNILEGVGGEVSAKGIVELPLTVMGRTSLHTFWILPKYSTNLLGVDWFENNQAILDWPQKKIFISGSH